MYQEKPIPLLSIEINNLKDYHFDKNEYKNKENQNEIYDKNETNLNNKEIFS